MTEIKECLSCSTTVTGKYCSNCGQSSSTHRFSLKHFFQHDLIHGGLHLDATFPKTIIDLIVNPGQGVRNYIQGDRKKYFNAITLIIILIGFSHFLEQKTIIQIEDVFSFEFSENQDIGNQKEIKLLNNEVFNLMRDYPKTTILSIIPFYALLSILIFRKANQNYAEHLVLTTYKMSIIVFLGYIVAIGRIYSNNVTITSNLYTITLLLGMVYTIVYMAKYFMPFYDKKKSTILRSIAYTISEFIFQIAIGLVFGALYMAFKLSS